MKPSSARQSNTARDGYKDEAKKSAPLPATVPRSNSDPEHINNTDPFFQPRRKRSTTPQEMNQELVNEISPKILPSKSTFLPSSHNYDAKLSSHDSSSTMPIRRMSGYDMSLETRSDDNQRISGSRSTVLRSSSKSKFGSNPNSRANSRPSSGATSNDLPMIMNTKASTTDVIVKTSPRCNDDEWICGNMKCQAINLISDNFCMTCAVVRGATGSRGIDATIIKR
jgi:hypothetical protein